MANPPSTRSPNRLIHETSPYLLQHAHNPVDWYPWGEEALQLAKDQDKPLLLSIGYSACHWCHVMERESFENDEIATLMNRHYVCVKVDREERPDLDEIYMQATIAMNQGNGGWPMTVFLTPDQQPIFAGTYFPPTDKWGRPGFGTVLKKIAEGWEHDRAAITESATRFTDRLQTAMRVPAPMTVGQQELDSAVEQFSADFDPIYGGFGQAPKFPPAIGLAFLLRQYQRTRTEHVLHMVCKTLDAMAGGGMYDHVGGGFARYSTDERWLVPHFEKMLYDNALLARTYLEAFQVTGNSDYKRVTRETLDYVIREMTSPEGGYYSATDADSEGVEGKFFVWDPEEIREIAPSEQDAVRFCTYYDITADGNWEHHSIPNTPHTLEQTAEKLSCSPDELRQTIDRVKPLVYDARLKRVPPGLDDKIITAWNGMMISAMAETARVLRHGPYLESACRAADFLLKTLSRPDEGLYRTCRAGKAHLNAYLEDYAYLTEALIDVYEAGGEERYLTEAVRLGERLLSDFLDKNHGGFFTTANDHEALILRGREGPDGATPSGNAVAAMALARLSFHQDREDFREAATQAIRAYGQQIGRIPRGFAKTIMTADFLLNGPLELAFVGAPADPGREPLLDEVARHFVPYRIIAHGSSDDPESRHPLLKGKHAVEGKAALYVCRNYTCRAPLTDPKDVAHALTDAPREDSTSRTLASPGIPGRATAHGTAAYVSRIMAGSSDSAAHGYTTLGSTGLTNSRIGFGGYRTGVDQEDHRAALMKAIRDGCNLIDTSTNYADGDSERLVGSVIQALLSQKEVTRDNVIVVSKIGYVQGRNLQHAKSREQAGRAYPDVVKYGEDIWHCLHPEFLDDQLSGSLDRLGFATLDVCLLHNPEYFLSDAKQRKLIVDTSTLDELRTEFYRRIEQAFVYFEQQIDAGRIQYYGVSSNTSTAGPADPEATSLSHMLEAAQRAARQTGKSHHGFRVLQLPMNLFESGALLTANTGPGQTTTVLEFAQAHQVAILVNRPLNAIPARQRGMIRLADPRYEQVDTPFETQHQEVATLEETYRQEFAPLIPYAGKGLEPRDFFSLADELRDLRSRIHNLEHWDQIESQMIAPHINQAFQAAARHLSQEKATDWENWRTRYISKLLLLLKIVRQESARKSEQHLQAITTSLDGFLPDEKRGEPLSRKALWSLTSTPGVTCVLNGIRTTGYVEDSLTILGWEPLQNPRSIFENMQSP
ncbi:MAG: DUF255 domain-containing protein [Nitrospira sp.]|nr:DUF255 domain-containing protein [Nitrospira sp.]